MTMHHLKVSSPDGIGMNTNLTLNGEPLLCVTGLKLDLDTEGANRAELTLWMPSIDFEGTADIQLLPETVALLTKLGWTPPTD